MLKIGVETYLSEIKRLNTQQQAVMIIPGVQTSPFYYWEGNPFQGGLTAREFRKELLIVGISSPDDYHGLLQMHGGFSTRYAADLLPGFLIFFAVFLLAIYLTFQKRMINHCKGPYCGQGEGHHVVSH